jgi:hypothetical protein
MTYYDETQVETYFDLDASWDNYDPGWTGDDASGGSICPATQNANFVLTTVRAPKQNDPSQTEDIRFYVSGTLTKDGADIWVPERNAYGAWYRYPDVWWDALSPHDGVRVKVHRMFDLCYLDRQGNWHWVGMKADATIARPIKDADPEQPPPPSDDCDDPFTDEVEPCSGDGDGGGGGPSSSGDEYTTWWPDSNSGGGLVWACYWIDWYESSNGGPWRYVGSDFHGCYLEPAM